MDIINPPTTPPLPSHPKRTRQPAKDRSPEAVQKRATRSLRCLSGGSKTDTSSNHFQATVKSAESVGQATFSCKPYMKLQEIAPKTMQNGPCARTRLQSLGFRGLGSTSSNRLVGTVFHPLDVADDECGVVPDSAVVPGKLGLH